jgi:hypothetical protein
MRWTVDFAGGPQDVTVTTWGRATREGIFGVNRDLVSDERWLPGMRVLLDCCGLDTEDLDGEDIESIMDLLVSLEGAYGPAMFAILAPDPYAFGVAEVFARNLPQAQFRFHAFSAGVEALAWLGEIEGRSAEGGNRTHTPRGAPDFESGASASSATSAGNGS